MLIKKIFSYLYIRMVNIKDLRNEIADIVKEDIIQGGRKKANKNKNKKPSENKKKVEKKPIGFVWEYKNDNGKITKNYKMIYSTQSAKKAFEDVQKKITFPKLLTF